MGFVTPPGAPERAPIPWRGGLVSWLVAAAAIALLIARFPLLATINVNWDEFMFLSRVHEHARGDLTTAFQTFHVHLFGWVAGVDGLAVDQIIAARRVLFLVSAAIAALVFVVTRHLADTRTAWLAVLAWTAFSFVQRHGESFRADPPVALLCLAAIALLVLRFDRPLAVVGAAVSFALALAISVKSVFWAPTLAAIAVIHWWRASDPPARRMHAYHAAYLALAAVVAYGAFTMLHSAAVEAASADVARRATGVGPRMFVAPQMWVLDRSLGLDWAFWLLWATGALVALRDAVREDQHGRVRALLVLALQLPLGTLLVYRNTFPYFYVTLIPTAAVACGYGVARVIALGTPWLERRRAWIPGVVLLPAAILALRGWQLRSMLTADGVALQRALLEVVHDIFPEPVPYIDRCGMVSGFPRAAMFMSSLVLERYRDAGAPVMAELVAERQPRFVLANHEAIELSLPWEEASRFPNRLLREDFEFLQRNFVHHWGPIWVPGRHLDFRSGVDVVTTIAVTGPYTVESGGAVIIDGAQHQPGAVVQLAAGEHRFGPANGTPAATLRFGDHLPQPGPMRVRGGLFWGL